MNNVGTNYNGKMRRVRKNIKGQSTKKLIWKHITIKQLKKHKSSNGWSNTTMSY